MWNLKYNTDELIYENGNRLTDIEKNFYGNQRERGWGRHKLGD